MVIFQLMLPRIWFWFECIDQFYLKYMVKCEGLLNTDLAEMLFTEHTSPFHEDLMWRWICKIWKMVPSACKQIFCQIRSFWYKVKFWAVLFTQCVSVIFLKSPACNGRREIVAFKWVLAKLKPHLTFFFKACFFKYL